MLGAMTRWIQNIWRMATEVQNGRSVTTKEAIVPNLTTLKHISRTEHNIY
jgi:hypothetical protein